MPRIKEVKFKGTTLSRVNSKFGYTVTTWKEALKESIKKSRFLEDRILHDRKGKGMVDPTIERELENAELAKFQIKF